MVELVSERGQVGEGYKVTRETGSIVAGGESKAGGSIKKLVSFDSTARGESTKVDVELSGKGKKALSVTEGGLTS